MNCRIKIRELAKFLNLIDKIISVCYRSGSRMSQVLSLRLFGECDDKIYKFIK